MSDLTLAARIAGGDESAFASIVETHHAAMIRLAQSFVRTRALAEEVVQDAWMAVLDGIARFEGRSTLKSWILGIVVKRALTKGAREGRQIPFSALEGAEERDEGDPDARRFDAGGAWTDPPRAEDRAPEDELLRKEAREVLTRALEALPASQRAVVVLRDIEGCSPEEACNVLGVSEPHQRVLLHRGRLRLRAALEKHERKD